MKSIYYFIMLVTIVSVTACGSTKKLLESQNQMFMQQMQQQKQQEELEANSNKQRVEKAVGMQIELSECELLSLDMSDGKLRAFGTAIDPDMDFARQIAVTTAKGQMSTDIKALALSVTDIYRQKIGVNGTNESANKIEQHINIMAENMVNNTRILKTAKFIMPDNTFRYEVCICLNGDLKDTLEDLISSDEELKITNNRQKFIDSYQEGLNRFRNMKESGQN